MIGLVLAGGIGTLAQSLLVGVPPIDPVVVRRHGAAVRCRARDRGVDAGAARGGDGSGDGVAGGVTSKNTEQERQERHWRRSSSCFVIFGQSATSKILTIGDSSAF